MAESPSEAEQFRPKDKKRPNPGQLIYVPARGSLPVLHGGLARVSESSTKRSIYVDEDPGTPYTWHELSFRQMELWTKYGTTRARLATFEEIREAEAQRHAEMEAQRARAERARELEWAPTDYPVINRGLMAVPVWNEHHRAKNWAAVVEVDPVAPGGFRRKWFNRGNGPAYYVVPDSLEAGDVVEFGADRVSFSGNRDGNRWYGVVLSVSDTAVRLQKCVNAADAASKSAGMRTARAAGSGVRVSSDQALPPPASQGPVPA